MQGARVGIPKKIVFKILHFSAKFAPKGGQSTDRECQVSSWAEIIAFPSPLPPSGARKKLSWAILKLAAKVLFRERGSGVLSQHQLQSILEETRQNPFALFRCCLFQNRNKKHMAISFHFTRNKGARKWEMGLNMNFFVPTGKEALKALLPFWSKNSVAVSGPKETWVFSQPDALFLATKQVPIRTQYRWVLLNVNKQYNISKSISIYFWIKHEV